MPRARAYLAVMTFRHLAVGMYATAWPRSFRTDTMAAIRTLAPTPAWGAAFIVIGMQGAVIVWTGRELHARLVLVASATVTAAWAMGFIVAGAQGNLAAPSIPIVWAALTMKDLVVAGMQLRLPVVELPAPEARRWT